MASRRYSDTPVYELGRRELPTPQFVQRAALHLCDHHAREAEEAPCLKPAE